MYPLLFRGWLVKLCGASSLRQAWRWRYVVLRGTQLAYFKKRKRNARPCGVVSLVGAVATDTLGRRRAHTFMVRALDYKPLVLRASTLVRKTANIAPGDSGGHIAGNNS